MAATHLYLDEAASDDALLSPLLRSYPGYSIRGLISYCTVGTQQSANKLFISRNVEHDYIIFRHRDLGFQSVSRLPRERYNHLHTSPQPCFGQCVCFTDDTISGAHISDSHYHCTCNRTRRLDIPLLWLENLEVNQVIASSGCQPSRQYNINVCL